MFTTVSILLIAIALVTVAALRRSSGSIPATEPESAVSAEEAQQLQRRWLDLGVAEVTDFVDRKNPRILDVRTPGETMFGVIPGAMRVPVQELAERVEELPRDGRPTLVYCAHGIRSAYACDFLERLEYENLYNLAGGVVTWPRQLEPPS